MNKEAKRAGGYVKRGWGWEEGGPPCTVVNGMQMLISCSKGWRCRIREGGLLKKGRVVGIMFTHGMYKYRYGKACLYVQCCYMRRQLISV
jgi:hypothetical protein